MSIEKEQPVSLAGLRRKFGDDYMITAVNSYAANKAKIKALVEALETIADTVPVFGMNPHARMGDPDNVKVRWNVHAIARAALATT